jgi:hypothetical protein
MEQPFWLREADMDEREIRRLVDIFFEYDNNMPMPHVHRGEFMKNFYTKPQLLT